MATSRETIAADEIGAWGQVDVGVDIIITGGGDLFVRTDDISPTTVDWTLQANQNIFIDSNYIYGEIDFNFYGFDFEGQMGATRGCFITNIYGQAIVGNLRVGGFWGGKITSEFVEADRTGDPAYLGHATLGGVGNARGNYGLYISPSWANPNTTAVGVFIDAYGSTDKASSDVELCYFEMGNGGNAGLQLKNDNMSDADGGTMYNMNVHDIYSHDTGGEAFYVGNTSTGDNQHTVFLHLHNTWVCRTGREGWQAGRLGTGSILENNVIEDAALGWLRANPNGGKNFQDKGMQIGCRNGGIIIRNNVVRGSGSDILFLQMDGSGDLRTGVFAWLDATAEDESTHVLLYNNGFFGSRYNGGYWQKSDMEDSYAIDSVNQGSKTFTHNGEDITGRALAGRLFQIDSSTGNDGFYTITSSTFTVGY